MTNKKLTHVALNAGRGVAALSGTLAVPTALTMLLQANLPAPALAKPDEAFFADRLAHKELQQQMRLERLDAKDLARDLRIQSRFDMNSARDVFSLTQNDLQGANSAQLMLGNINQTFNVGDRVSAAELTALRAGSNNNLVLDAKGRAESGSFSLNALENTFTSFNVDKVEISKNLTAYGDFSHDANFQFNGDLVNRGNIVGFSTNANNLTGNVFANNIANRASGSITSVLPTGNSSPVLTGALENFSLVLNTHNNIENAGSITSAGALTLNAGGSITNALGAGEVGRPAIQAAQSVNLNAGSGFFNNLGTIASTNGSINFAANSPLTAITISAPGGLFDAQNGAINIRNASDLNAGDVAMAGGDWLSKDLNIYAYQGTSLANIGRVTGDVTTNANEQHFYASTDNLILGDTCITGDPTYVNANGNITINGLNQFSENVAIIASGNITMSAGASIKNPGNVVQLIAGANVSTDGSQTSTVPGDSISIIRGVTVNFNGPQTGGNIDLTQGLSTVIDTSNPAHRGGGVLLVAMANGATGGRVLLGTNSIDARAGQAGQTGGNVDIYAASNASENTITVGSILTGGGGGTKGVGGAINIYTGPPKSTKSDNVVKYNSGGSTYYGDVIPSGIVTDNASILINGQLNSVGTFGATAGAITVKAGKNIQVNNVLAYGAGGDGGVSFKNGTAGGNGAKVDISTKSGNITLGDVNTSGGGGGGGGGDPADKKSAVGKGGAGGKAAAINIFSGGTTTIGNVYAVDGGKGGDANYGKGGPGGGSYGGGGGAGVGQAGGGGGYTGGGGTGFQTPGSGGGFAGGAGGGGGQAGSAGQGGSSQNGSWVGGTLGKGGTSQDTAGFNAPDSGADVYISSLQTLTTGGKVIGNSTRISTNSNGSNIVLGGEVTGFKEIDIRTTTGNVNGVNFNTPFLDFTTDSGSLGSSSQRATTNATRFLAGNGTGGGSVYLTKNVGGNMAIGPTSGLSVFDLNVNGLITTEPGAKIIANSIVLAGGINVETEASNINVTPNGDFRLINTGDVTINSFSTRGNITLGVVAKNSTSSAVMHLTGDIQILPFDIGTITLISDGVTSGNTGFIADVPSRIYGGNLVLSGTAHGSFGTEANPLLTSVRTLTTSTAGSLFLNNQSNPGLTINKSVAGSTAVSSPQSFSVISTAVGGFSGKITINGEIKMNGTNTNILLQSSSTPGNSGGIVMGAGVTGRLIADTIVLKDGATGAGSFAIGSETAPILTQARVGLGASTQNNVWLNNIGDASLLDSTLSAGSIYFLKNTGNIGKNGTSGTVAAGSIIIDSTGNIGDGENKRVNLDSAVVTLSSGGNVYANDINTGTILLKDQTANGVVYKNKGNVFNFKAENADQLQNFNLITSQSLNLTAKTINIVNPTSTTKATTFTATTGDILLNANIKTAELFLSALGANRTIVQDASKVIEATAIEVDLSNGTANLQGSNKVGSFSSNVSGAGVVLFKSISDLKISGLSGVEQNAEFTYKGKLVTSGTLEGIRLVLKPLDTSENSVELGGTININGNVEVEATGKGGINVTGTVDGASGNRTFKTAAGNIAINNTVKGANVNLITNGGSITQTAAGVITANQLTVNLNNGGSAGLDFAANAVGTFVDSIVGGGRVGLRTSGNLTLQSIAGANQILVINAGGDIVSASPIDVAQIDLLSAGPGGILPLTTSATLISMNVTSNTGNASVTSTATGPVTLRDSSAGDNGIFTFNASGPVSVETVEGGQVNITGTGAIKLIETVGTSTSTLVNITSTGAGDIDAAKKGAISGNTVTLVSNGGSIVGTKPKDGLDINAANVSANTNGSGHVFLESLSTGPVNLGNSTAGQTFTMTAIGDINTANVVTSAGAASSTGGIKLSTKTGNINVGTGAQITANGGDIYISADSKTATVFIGSNATLLGTSTVANVGHVTINTGAKPKNQTGPTPPNVTVNETLGGIVYFGTPGITAAAPNNVLNAEGRNIDFSGDTVGSIVLGGGVTITADPPVGTPAHAALLAAYSMLPESANSTRLAPASSTTFDASNAITFAGSSFSSIVPASSSSTLTNSQLTSQSSDYASNLTMPAINATLPSLSQGQLDQEEQLNRYVQISSVPMMPRNIYTFGRTAQTFGIIEAVSLEETKSNARNVSQSGVNASKTPNSKVLVGYVDKGGKGKPAAIERSGAVTKVDFASGNLLCSPVDTTAVLETKFGPVTIAPNSLVLAMATEDGLAIFNLDDRHQHSVALQHSDRKFAVAPGNHLFVTDRGDVDFSEVNVSERILYTGVQKSKLRTGHHVFNAQFFIPSAIETCRPLFELVTSKEPAARETANRLMKTTAILMHLHGGVSNYKQHTRRRETAWQQ